MPMLPDSRLGHYDILDKLGEGGMGEVYRARDTRLNRDVAIKVISARVIGDAERVSRFRREAELLASLNHPNVAHVYGVELSDAGPALVMELVDGRSLDRLTAGQPMPVADAIAIARQIAAALEAAHERAIVHRDLKPANVMVSGTGAVKVLDFGLAKAVGPENTAGSDVANSPTLTAAATGIGVILGTAAYMSPEQAKGRLVDRRADIWAFGVLLFELLAGRRPFDGDSVSEVLASIIRDEPRWDALPPDLPPAVRRLLRRCLDKDPTRRLRDIAEGMLQLDEEPSTERSLVAAEGEKSVSVWRRALPFGGAVVLTAAVVSALWWIRTPAVQDGRTVRLTAPLPLLSNLRNAQISVLAISRDGSQLAYVARDPSSPASQLFLRSIDQFDAAPLPAITGGAASPFFSADGKSLGYLSQDRRMYKLTLLDGQRTELGVLPALPAGAPVWGPDNRIVFGTAEGLFVMGANGGDPEKLTTPDRSRGELGHSYPTLVGDTGLVIFTITTNEFDDSRLAAISLQTRKVTDLGPGSQGKYLSSGHVAYVLGDRGIRVAPFDPAAPSLGVAVPIVPNVRFRAFAADFAVSDNGTLAYIVGDPTADHRTLVWVDRKGSETPVEGIPPRAYAIPRISPDETRIALDIDDRNEDIEIWDLTLKQMQQLTTEKGQDNHPVWTWDRRSLFFSSARTPQYKVNRQNADGSGKPETVFTMTGGSGVSPYALTRDGARLLFRLDGNLAVLTLASGSAPQVFFEKESFSAGLASLSVDDRYFLYHSNESGREPPSHVFVRPFPDALKQRWQISSLRGGRDAVFSRDGKEIFYLDYDGWMMSAAVSTQPAFSHRAATRLFPATQYFRRGIGRSFDVTKDGRFLMIKALGPARQPETDVRVVLNWFSEIQLRLSGK